MKIKKTSIDSSESDVVFETRKIAIEETKKEHVLFRNKVWPSAIIQLP